MSQEWTDFVSSFSSPASSLPGLPGSIASIAGATAQGFAMGGPVGAAAAGLESSFQELFNLIGRGRKEADIIVPLQNEYGRLLTVVNDRMGDSTVTIQELAAMYQAVVDGYRRFDAFTRHPQFTDGRASYQARETIRPLVDGKNDAGMIVRNDGGTLGNIERLIIARGGIAPGNVHNGGAPGETPAMAPGAGGGNNRGLLLAGGGALVAKLLGWF